MKELDPKSEKAQKRACRMLKEGTAMIIPPASSSLVYVAEKESFKTIAIFDLRDCYRLRKPLTGIKKKVAEIIRGKK